jgi:hypothetical protein
MSVLEIIGVALTTLATAFWIGFRKGKTTAMGNLVDRDRLNADKTRNAADRARRADDAGNVDAADFLRTQGRLRRD